MPGPKPLPPPRGLLEVPDRFLDRDPGPWRLRPGLRLDDLAAAVLQQRVLAAARSLLPAGAPGRELARLLSLPDAGPAERLLSGRQQLTLRHLAGLALALGDELFAGVPRHAAELVPDAVLDWVPDWAPGAGPVPVLPDRPGPDPAVRWVVAAAELCRYAAGEVAGDRGRHLGSEVLAHRALLALDRVGLPQLAADVGGDRVRYQASPPLTVRTLALLGPSPGAAGNGLVAGLLHALAAEDDRAVAVLVLGAEAAARLPALLAGVDVASAGDAMALPVQALHSAGLPVEVGTPDLRLLFLAARHQADPRVSVLVVEVAKT